MIWIILAILVWIVCGVFAYGLTFAYFQETYPMIAEQDAKYDRRFAGIISIFGPLGLFVILIKSYRL